MTRQLFTEQDFFFFKIKEKGKKSRREIENTREENWGEEGGKVILQIYRSTHSIHSLSFFREPHFTPGSIYI
jgi:hypothetical protein